MLLVEKLLINKLKYPIISYKENMIQIRILFYKSKEKLSSILNNKFFN